MDTLGYFQQKIFDLSRNISNEAFVITSFWKINMAFRPNVFELGYTDTVVIAYTQGSGACFCFGVIPEVSTDLIGKDARHLTSSNLFFRIASLDAAFSQVLPLANIKYKLTGLTGDKAYGRANIVCNEVARLVGKNKLTQPKILTIGSVGSMIHELVSRRYKVFATDLDPLVINSEMSGITIQDGAKSTLSLLEEVDIAIVTGMTLATETIDDVIEVANRTKTSLVLFAQTGANCHPYLRELGVDTVVSEFFPFYMFPGESEIHVYRSAN